MTRPTKLLNRHFLLLWQGQFVSLMGSQAFAIAMMFWIKHETGSASLMGLIMMVSNLPEVILGPVAGTFADRHSRKRIIVVCDVLNGLAVLSLAGLLFFAPEAVDTALVWLFVVSVFTSIVISFFRPAISASIPDLVPAEKVAAANSMNQVSLQLSTFLGQGSAGVLYRLLGAPVLFLIDGLSYLFSAVSEAFITIPQNVPQKSGDWRELMRSFKSDMIEGLRYVWKRVGMRNLFLMAAFVNLFFSPFAVLLPFYVEDFLAATPDWFGYMLAAWGLGSLIGYSIAGAVKLSGKARCYWMIAALIALGGGMGGLSLLTSATAAVAMMVAVGVMVGFFSINLMTILQITTPSEIRGRVFGLLGTLSMGLMPIGLGLAGVVADWTNHNIPLIFAFCGVVIVLAAVIFSSQREFRSFLSYEHEKEIPGSQEP